jgi:hypothetical protein
MNKKLLSFSVCAALLFLLISTRSISQQMVAAPVTNVVTQFSPVTLVGGSALFWGNQFAAITNQAGTPVFSGTALAAFFGAAGVPHQLIISSINNPFAGTNVYTLTFTAQ